MKLLFVTFTKISKELIKASLSFHNDKMARCIAEVEGVSRKQCAFLFCKQGIVSWDSFDQLKEMAIAQGDPRFCKVARHRQSREEAREEKLADICDDMNCSPSEAELFLTNGTMPNGW
jgi:hypothetical protein